MRVRLFSIGIMTCFTLSFLPGKNNAMRPENLSTANLKLFPNELPAELFNELIKPKKVRFISSPTENAQARYLPQWVHENLSNEEEKENAVVLCNEALLLPVLHSR